MKVIITGAGGYIGSVASQLFLKRNFEVVAIDNFTTGFKKPLQILQKEFGSTKLRFYKRDLNFNLDPIFDKEKGVDAVIHFAANCLVDDSMKNPQKYFQNNVCGSQNLLTAVLKYGIKNIVFSSTCAVYGDVRQIPVMETHPTNPTNPYGESKKIAEEIIRWYGKILGLNYVILRYFNVCGASSDGQIGDSKKPSVHLVQNAIRAALGIEDFSLTCPEVNTPDKTPIRDYVDVVDVAEAHIKAVDYLMENGSSEVINLGTGKGNSVLEIINIVQNATGKKFNIKKSKSSRIGEYGKIVASIDKAKQKLGWQPTKTLEDSIKSSILWYEKHPNGWAY
ncbi:UDP-glucose 4-epimerase GalE [Candidatus Daviesbacteria bacterium]|nr:UDP-glucose 4-epimerase GalE [Candidatus Daviesbacteria bacterium]